MECEIKRHYWRLAFCDTNCMGSLGCGVWINASVGFTCMYTLCLCHIMLWWCARARTLFECARDFVSLLHNKEYTLSWRFSSTKDNFRTFKRCVFIEICYFVMFFCSVLLTSFSFLLISLLAQQSRCYRVLPVFIFFPYTF